MSFDAGIAANIEDIYPLSPMQQGMLFHSLYAPETGVYFEQSSWKLHGDLNVDAFERAWQRVVDRHPSLRTAFLWEDLDEPLQVVYQQVEVSLDRLDWRGLSHAERAKRLEDFLQADRARGFEFSDAPLMRLALIQTDEDEYHFVWSHHHLLLDGWSQPIIFQEAFSFYEAFRQGRDVYMEPAHSYSEYVAWLQGQDMAEAEATWRDILQGFLAPTPLPVDKIPSGQHVIESAKPDDQEADYVLHKTLLPAETAAALQGLVRKHKLTLNTVIQGAWALLLSRYSSEEDVVFGATVSGRPADLPDAESIVGLFINTLPVRVKIRPDDSVLSWLKGLQSQQVKMRQYEYSPLVEVHGWTDVPRDLPLFNSLLVFENYPVSEIVRERGVSLSLERGDYFTRTNYPLTIAVSPGSQIGLEMAYDSCRFEQGTIQRMMGHFCTLLENLAAHPEQRLAQVSLLSEAERRQVLVDWNNTRITYLQDGPIHRLFEAQVERTPDAEAVFDQDQPLTYCHLNQRANQLAHFLQKLGVGPDVLVGISVDRSAEMLVGILGVLKAGGAYLPMDPHFPAERLAFMLEDSRVSVLLTQEHLLERLPSSNSHLVCLDSDWPTISQESRENPPCKATAENLAYVIYTSGSTGTPKGVLVPHRSLVNHAQSLKGIFALVPGDRVLQFISLSFDASAEEIYPALISGAALVLPDASTEFTGRDILRLCERQHISVLHLPASFWHQCVDDMLTDDIKVPPSLKVLLVGGETPSIERLRAWCERANQPLRFLNAYGPTETTITATIYQINCTEEAISRLSRIPIGRPIANVQSFILDTEMQPAPVGVPGELFIGGAGLTRGYMNRPELTAEKFVLNPFVNAEFRMKNEEYDLALLYRTGDQARYLPDGNIEFLGRMDHQVKLRGFRVELGEIEAVISRYPGVGQSAAIVREDVPGDKRLVAYLVPNGEVPAIPELRSYLKGKLPEYMLPSAFVTLDELPMTPSGKLDRRALPAPDGRPDLDGDFVAPRNAVEEILAGLWAEVLKIERVGVLDNFFELGGHSLLATQLLSRIRQAFQVELPLRGLFENPTVAGMAGLVVAARESEGEPAAPPIRPVNREEALPLSFAQQRLWFLDQLEPGNLFYNIPTAVRLSGQLDVDALEGSLNEIVRRHEPLRTTFAAQDGRPVQVIAPRLTIPLEVIDLRHLPGSAREAEAQRLATLEAQKPFDLARGPLLRAALLQLEDDEFIALLTLHHIVSDGWSMGILIRELGALYQSYHQGEPSTLPDLLLQYADFAHWQREWLQGEVLEQQLNYWKEQLAGSPPILDLPTDRPRPAVKTSNGAIQTFSLPPELSAAVHDLSRQEGTTVFMTLLAAFQILLHRYSGQDDITVGSAIANRTRAETEGLIGFFVNTLVLRSDLSGDPSFRELLERVREVTLGAYAHQDVPFEMLVEALQPERNLSYTPLFQVGFDMQTAPMGAMQLTDLTLNPVQVHSGTAPFDLLLSLTDTPQGLVGSLEYNTDLYEAATILRLLGHFQVLLQGVAEDPDQSISELPMLSEAEKQQMLVAWNDTGMAYQGDECIHQRFENQVAQRPEAIALTFEEQSLTYAELNRRANQLAHYLRKLGVGPDSLVGISTERSPEMIVGILGTLKAGGAYLPLDPKYPGERLAFMIADSGVKIILTQESLLPRKESGTRNQESGAQLPDAQSLIPNYLCLDRDWPIIAQECSENPPCNVTPENLAYVIYTSGSTGKPKGAMLRHRGLCSLSEAQRIAFEIDDGARVLQFSPFSFDASVWETFMALGNGATLCLARQETLTSGLELVRLFREREITTVTLPPSLLTVLPAEELPALQTVIAAGEACTQAIVDRWSPGRRFFNAYGPTETTVCASMAECQPGEGADPPIGRPIANMKLYILDANMQPVPIGVPGELHVGGIGLARGYLNRPDLTAEKFIPSPFVNAEYRMQNAEYHSSFSVHHSEFLYRTGDLVRYRPDGNIEFLGRIDHQVKVRGFRIELGEIEAALRGYPGLREGVVIAREDIPGDKRLVAYVVPEEQPGPNVGDIRNFLRDMLPEYMLPSAFVTMEVLPQTPSGKIDRRGLPAPEASRPDLESAYVAPRNETEQKLADICSGLLGLEKVGVHDNFFELGGHSLLATQFISRVRETFQVELPLRNLFEHPTVAALANSIEDLRQKGDQIQAPAIRPVSRQARRMKRSSLMKDKPEKEA